MRVVHLLAALFLSQRMGIASRVRLSPRIHHSQELVTDRSYKVTLLIIRHGLSCSNVVEKWISKADFGRGNIADPALAGVGQYGSEEAGKAIRDWLKQKNYTLDAALSSVLGRAMETSLLTFGLPFPEFSQPLEVVPYVREDATESPSNMPRDSHIEQLDELAKAMKPKNITNYQVDYHLADGVGFLSSGNWDDFLKFLKNIYLPRAIANLGKKPNSRIVLAVTTHSKLIGKFLKSKCELKKKIQNNGVLHMEYNYRQRDDEGFRVGQYSLEELEVSDNSRCDAIHHGLDLHNQEGKLKEMCVSDVGSTCMKSILDHAIFGSSMPKLTSEHRIFELAQYMSSTELELDSRQQSLRQQLVEIAKELRSSNGKGGGITLGVMKAKELSRQISEMYDDLVKDLATMQGLKKQQCWSGGFPDVKGYLQYSNAKPFREAEQWWEDDEPQLPERFQDHADFKFLEYIESGDQLGAECLVAPNTIKGVSSIWSSISSTCHSGLRCYNEDGERPNSGEKGICAIPRTKTCDLSKTKVIRRGCRPKTRCVKGNRRASCEYDTNTAAQDAEESRGYDEMIED